jgi:DNA polymerase-1
MGSGKRKAKLMIVGEAPGAREDEQHRAFVGPAGQLLDELLAEAGINRDDCYITNAVKCRPVGNETPSRAQANTCQRAFGAEEVRAVRPDWILTLGNTALQAVAGKSGITKHRGKPATYEGIPVFPTFHPAAALRSSHYLDPIRADLQNLARRIGIGGYVAAPRTRTRLITTRSQLTALCQKITESSCIAFDVETTGLRAWEENVRIVTFGVSWAPGEAAVVPIEHSTWQKRKWKELVYRELKRVMEDPAKKYIAHNGKFDCGWLARFGIYVPLTFDTMIAAHLLDENRPKGLKPLSQMLLGADDYAEDTKDCYNADLKKLAIYNGKDCDYTLRLYELFREQLIAQPRVARLFRKLMMPASNLFTRIEASGIYVDPERMDERFVRGVKNLNKIEAYMNQFLPDGVATINYNSPKQVGEWLFGYLKLPIIERTKTHAPSTAESSLLQLSSKHKAVSALLRYRKWAKYLSTYLGPWQQGRDAKSRIHPTYRLTGTVTGRLSSAEPNLQQVPRDPFIRGIIGAADGWRFVEADYSQVELRLTAMLAREKNMLQVLAEGHDLHTNTAAEITGKKAHKITKDERVIWGKHPNFGLVFSMKPEKYQEYCRNNGIDITMEEAEDTYHLFHKAYPGLKRWHDRVIRVARAERQVVTAMGRVRHLPDIVSAHSGARKEAERQAINSVVQGLATDICLSAAVRIGKRLDPRVARIVGSVHDALLFEVREEVTLTYASAIKAEMENMRSLYETFGAVIDVPIKVDVEIGTHWSEGEIEV